MVNKQTFDISEWSWEDMSGKKLMPKINWQEKHISEGRETLSLAVELGEKTEINPTILRNLNKFSLKVGVCYEGEYELSKDSSTNIILLENNNKIVAILTGVIKGEEVEISKDEVVKHLAEYLNIKSLPYFYNDSDSKLFFKKDKNPFSYSFILLTLFSSMALASIILAKIIF